MAKNNPDYEDTSQDDDDDEEEGLTLEKIKHIVGFFVRAPRRRPKLAIATLLLVLTAAILAAIFLPRSYSSDLRILAQRNVVLPALGNPNRSIPRDTESPTHNVAETIMQRDSLVALIKQVNLVNRWDAARPPALRLKDRVMASISGPLTDDQKMRALIGMLEHRLFVMTDDSSITITVDWPNPEMSYEMVTLVQKNFFDARYDADVSVISEAISILEQRAKSEAATVDAALADLLKLEEAKRRATPPPSNGGAQLPRVATGYVPHRSSAGGAGAGGPATDPSDMQALEQIRKQIKQLEDGHDRRLGEAQSQLADAQATLGPLHPTVVGLKQKVEALTPSPPELASLKGEERALVAKIASGASAAAAPPQGAAPAAPSPAPAPARAPGSASSAARLPTGNENPFATEPVPEPNTPPGFSSPNQEDGATTLGRARLLAAAAKYSEILGRIDSAKMELDVAKAAFKYTYSVVRPAEMPTKPRKPNVPVLLGGGLVASIVLALLAAGLADLLQGRYIEPWQVERLKIPVLGELPPST